MITVHQVSIRNLKDVIAEMVRVGAPTHEMEAVSSRALQKCLRVWGVSARTAHALKQGMLAGNGEAALPDDNQSEASCDLLLFGTLESYKRALAYIPQDTDELRAVAEKIKQVLMRIEGTTPPPPTTWNGRTLEWGERTFVMGILNVTPDSFYAGSRNPDMDQALATARYMIDTGADIIDIGGESTRPGAEPVSEDDELKRVLPPIRELRKEFPDIFISIDTYKSRVAQAAFEAGADMLNDISALGMDENLARVAADSGVPVCLMHMQGTPRNMQAEPSYDKDVCAEIIKFLEQRIEFAVQAGIAEEKIIADPGIGFGKTVEHNLEIMNRLQEFRSLGRPVLVGASRKSFIGKTLGLSDETGRLEGSLAVAALAVAGGADIVRVHDVPETVKAVKMADAIVRKKRLLERIPSDDQAG